MANRDQGPRELSLEEANQDRYPTFGEVVRRIIGVEGIEDVPVERVEVTALASGEATYRVWMPRAEEAEGGYLPAR